MSRSTAPTFDIGEKLDTGPWGRYQKIVLFMVAFTVMFDGLDIQILGLAIPALMQEWGLPRAPFTNVLALSLIGMTIGTIIGGWVGDRWGRRAGLIGSVYTFGILTILAVFATDITSLAVLRFLAGLGLGGALPNSSALSSEVTPLRYRAHSVMLTILCVPLGSALGGLIAEHVLPLWGWQALFIIGGVLPIIVATALIFVLPESPRYLIRFPGRHSALANLMARFGHPVPVGAAMVNLTEKPSHRTSLLALFTAEYWRDTTALWIASFFCLIGTYSVMSWLPAVLNSTGLDQIMASKGIKYYSFGGIIGILASTLIIGRIGSKKLMLGLCLGVVLSAFYLRGMHISPETGTQAILIIGIMGIFLNATQTSMFALAANVYVSQIRGTGVGGALGVGRIGGVLSSYIVPFAMTWNGSVGYFTMIGISLFISLIALAMVTRHVPAHRTGAIAAGH